MKAASAAVAFVWLSCGLLVSDPAEAAQKPRWIPVTIEYSIPADLKAGDEVTTVFVFKASAFVPRLVVNLDALDGLVWVEGDKAVTFDNVGEGQQREVRIRLRLAASRGRLAVTMQAVYDKSRFGDTVPVDYGEKR